MKKSGKVFRKVIWTLGVLLVFAIFLHTPPVRNLVRGTLARFGEKRISGKIEVGWLNYKLWNGSAELHDVDIKVPGLHLQADRIEIAFFPKHGLSLQVDRARMTVSQQPESAPEKRARQGPSYPWSFLKKLGTVRVTDVLVEWTRDQSGRTISGSVALERLDKKKEDGRWNWSFQSRLSQQMPGRSAVPLEIEGNLGLERESLRLDGLHLSSAKNSLTASGFFQQVNPWEGNIQGEFQADTSLTETIGLALPVQGSLSGAYQLEASDSGLNGILELASPGVNLAGTGPWTIHGKGRLQGENIFLESIVLSGYGGSIESQGRIDLTQGNIRVRVLADGIDVDSLAAAWQKGLPQLATRAGAEMDLSFEGGQLDRANGKGSLRLAATSGNGLPLAGTLNLDLERGRLQVQSEGLRIAEGSAELKATLDRDGIDAEYGLKFPASGLKTVLSAFSPDPPEPGWDGLLSASGHVAGAYSDLSATASVSSEGLAIHSQKIVLGAELEWGKTGLIVHSARVRSGKGNLKIHGSLPMGRAMGNWDLSGTMESFDLSAFVERFGFAVFADGFLEINGPAQAPSWKARLNASIDDTENESRQATMDLEAHGQEGVVHIDDLKAEIGGGSLVASGSYRLGSHEIGGRLSGSGIRIRDIAGLPENLEKLESVLSLDGDVSGTPGDMQGRLSVEFDELSINGVPLPRQSLRVRIEDGQAAFTETGPQVFLAGSCRLHRPYPFQVNVDLSSLPADSFLKAFADLPDVGIASAIGRIELNSSLEELSNIRYKADISEVKGTYRKQDWALGPFSADGDRTSLRLRNFRLSGVESSLSLDGIIPFGRDGAIDLKIDGRIGLEIISLFSHGLEIDGSGQLGLNIRGTAGRPEIEGDLTIAQGAGRFRGIPLENLDLQVHAEKSHLRLGTLSFQVLGGEVEASGDLFMSPQDRVGQMAVEWTGLDVGRLLSNAASSNRQSVRLSGKAQLSIPDFKTSLLSCTGVLTKITTSLGSPPISLQAPVEWVFERGRFSHSALRLAGEKTDLEAVLKTAMTDSRLEFEAKVNGHFNAGEVSGLIPGRGLSFSDTTEIQLDIALKSGAMTGELSLNGGRIHLSEPPISIAQIQAQLSVDNRTVKITSLMGRIGSGNIAASGQFQFEEWRSPPRADIQLILTGVPFSATEGVFLVVSGELQLQGDAQPYTLSGDITVPRFLYQREMNAATESLLEIDRQLKVLEGRTSLADRIALKIKVEVADFRLENRLARLSAEGVFSATGTLPSPELTGSMSLKAGGTLDLGRARIEISDGRVILEDFPERPIELDVGGITRVGGVYIELRVQGPIDNLQTQLQAPYRSDLTQGDMVMLLMTGRTSQAAVSEAGTVAAENLAGAIGDMLQKGVGESVFIDVSSDQSFFSYDTDPTTWFSLGKEVLPNIYVIYATDLGGTRRRVVLGYLPKELPVRLRLVTEDDGRKMLEVNHRLEFGFRTRQEQPGERPGQGRLGRVSFEGKSPLDEGRLRKLIKLKPGKKYDAWAAQKAADRIRKELEKNGYLNARVDPETAPEDAGRRDLTFLIDSGKRIQFFWKGDKIEKRTRQDIESLWNTAGPEDVMTEKMVRRAESVLRAERYFLARVTVDKTVSGEDVRLEILVDKGPRGAGVALRFEGNEILSDKELAAVLPEPSKPRFFEAIEGNAALLRNALRVRYAAEGHLQISVRSVVAEYDEVTREYRVTVALDEGGLSLVSDVSLPFGLAELDRPNGPALQLKAGEPFRIDQYLHDRSALNRYYEDQGYAEPRVAGILKPSDDKISVIFSLTNTSRPLVGNIRLARPGKTRETAVRELLTLKEGDLILPSEVDRSRKRLFDTRVFKSVDIQAVESPGNPESRDLVIDLIEKKDVEFNYGLRYAIEGPSYGQNSDSDNYSALEVGGRLQFQNIFGNTHRYGISGYLFGKQQSGRVFFESETFFRLPVPTQVYVSSEENRELEISGFEERIRKIAFQQYYRLGETFQGMRWSERLRFQWNYSYRNIRLNPFDTTLDPVDTNRGSVSLSLIGDTRDSFINPTRGAFWSLSSEFSRTWLGSEVNFNKLYGQGFLYVSLAQNVIWVSGLRLGVVPGENPLLIIEDRFKAGGPSTVRAFALNSLGPKNEKGEPLGGQALAVFNQELRFPLYKSLHGGLFYDTGSVFLLASKMNLGGLRHCAGAGLRYLLPFGPVRVDWAYVLDPEQGEKRSRFIFTLGHAF